MAVICCYYGTVLVSFEEPVAYTSKPILLNLPVTKTQKIHAVEIFLTADLNIP